MRFSRTKSATGATQYQAEGVTFRYTVERDGKDWLLTIRRLETVAGIRVAVQGRPVEETTADRMTTCKDIATEFEALGDGYRSADHGHRERFTEAVLRAYGDASSSREEEGLTQAPDSSNVPSRNTTNEHTNQGEITMAAKTTTDTKPSAAEIKADVETALEALTTADTQDKVDGLSAQIQESLKGLRVNQRVGLEMRRKEAVAEATDRLKEAAKPSTEVATKPKASASWMEMKGGEEEAKKLMEAGVSRIREGAEIGLKAADLFKEVANVIFVGRLRLENKAGLPDITGRSQGARNLSTDMFTEAKKTVAEDQVDLLEFHASLAKGVQNRMTDVTVEFLRKLAGLSWEDAAELFPFLAGEGVKRILAKMGPEAPEDADPETLVRYVYAQNGIDLPTETRAELAARKRAEAKELENKKEEAPEGEGEGEGEGQEDTHTPAEEKLLADAAKLADTVKKLGAKGKKLEPELKAALKARLDDALKELAVASAALA
jgi:hypothetical protein